MNIDGSAQDMQVTRPHHPKRQRFRKPLRYPLSYDGDGPRATCQRVRVGARAYGPVLACWSPTRGAHGEHTRNAVAVNLPFGLWGLTDNDRAPTAIGDERSARCQVVQCPSDDGARDAGD
jgi:hypothetical protein